MKLTVASPSGGASYDNVTYVSLWCREGQIGVLPHHADFIAALRPGQVRIERDTGAINGVAGSGFVRIQNGDIYLSAEQWTDNPAELAIDKRQAEIEAALAKNPGEATKARLNREKQFLLACSKV